MGCCSPKVKCYTTYSVGIFFSILGIIMIFCWPLIYNNILNTQLTLNKESKTYNMWKETPIPMYLDIYLFNWVNVKEVQNSNWKVKPYLIEMGPYVFREKHVRVNMTWNKNNTIQFQQVRTWHFEPSMSNGSLTDKITHLNIIPATVGYMIRNQTIWIQRIVNLFLKGEKESLIITKSVQELLFDGYDDKVLSFIKGLNLTNVVIPYDKFGWFYGRNESATYDGVFDMYTGMDDIYKTGIVSSWNGFNHTPYYPGHCGDVVGTTGELWPPVDRNDTISLFSSDLCSSVPLNNEDNMDIMGISGKHFVGQENAFDNGKKYPENLCYDVGEHMPTGVRNVSQCRFGAPAFISFPHFYLADKSYQDSINGLKPNKQTHGLYIVIEPKTGIPLSVRARVQINILIQQLKGLEIYENVKQTLFPMLWFVQRADLTEEYADQVKLLLTLENLGVYTGCGLTGIGILIVLVALFITFQKRWKGNEIEFLITESN